MDIEFYELIDTKEQFELKINGVPINCVREYEIKGTPEVKELTIKFSIPSENIKILSGF